MKLSKAILLGSTMVGAKAGAQFFPKTRQGCALGMAAIARGCTFRRVKCTRMERRTLGVENVWGAWILRDVARPCSCWRLWFPREMRIKDVIAHLFDYHVMKKRNWTLERLVQWVETVEPKENVPEPAVPRRHPPTLELRQVFPPRRVNKDWDAEIEALWHLAIDRNAGGGRTATLLRLALCSSLPGPSSQRGRRQYSA